MLGIDGLSVKAPPVIRIVTHEIVALPFLLGIIGKHMSYMHLSSLDGSNGFRLDDPTTSELRNLSLSSAGDLNGDGLNDFIVGGFLTADSVMKASIVARIIVTAQMLLPVAIASQD